MPERTIKTMSLGTLILVSDLSTQIEPLGLIMDKKIDIKKTTTKKTNIKIVANIKASISTISIIDLKRS
jgi:hypothetical protein